MHNLQIMINLNLTKQYSEINSEIFSNKLPSDIPVKWNHSKTALGKTQIRSPRFGKPEISISISKFFICSKKEYTETLIHEMIHVLMVINGEYHKDTRIHGALFQANMNRINRDFPHYKISIREKKQLPVDISKIKNMNGFFLITEEKQYFNLYCKEIDKSMQKQIIKALKRGFKIRTGAIYFFSGKYEELASAPVRRSAKTLTGKIQYLHNNKTMESLFDKIKKDFPYGMSIN